MKVTVTFPEIVRTFDLGDDCTLEEFLEYPAEWLDVYVSNIDHQYDWEIEEDA